MSLRFHRRILDHVRHEDFTPRRAGDLAVDLNVPAADMEEFQATIREMTAAKVIEVSANGNVSLPSLAALVERGGTVTGVFRKNARGFGFVEPQEAVREGSVFIPPDATGDALHGDVVRASVTRDRAGGPGSGFSGEVVEVVKRKHTSYSGTMVKRGAQWLVEPDGRQISDFVVIRDAESKNVRAGDKVVFELVAFPEGGMLGEGVIVRVLGEAGRPDVETQAMIAAYDLPGEFPDECIAQAREAAADFDRQIGEWHAKGASALTLREDITKDFILTIDPPDAKDYDDAISIRRVDEFEGGGWELGVHIADVAHFIPRGSPLDVEALDRGNSCYLPRLVIPMLPEVLSNGICSLQEGVPRFCKSAYMIYDSRGNVRGERTCSTLIKSAKRLTYLEAQALIDGDIDGARKHAKTPPKYTDELLAALKEMNTLSRQIQARRDRQGMIVLDLPVVVLKYDEQGHVVDAEQEDDAFTHKLIEMFMVEANEVLGRQFERLGVPLMRRIHPDPVPGDVDSMRKVALVAGFRIPKNPTREELQGLLKATHGTPAARAVHIAVLRTLSKAEYSPALIGHFALASEAYAHFTSPIRRYADLTVHRALAEYLKRTDNGKDRPRNDKAIAALGETLRNAKGSPDEAELVQIGKHISQREVNAESAERDLRNFLVLQLLEKHIGEVFRGVVTGINPRGIFVQIEKYLADGFVKSEDLPGDTTRENLTPMWKIDQKSGALTDIRSGRSFNFGDLVSVKIANVDLAKRQMDLVIDDASKRAAGKAKKPLLSKFDGGGPAGGMSQSRGAGFGSMTGSQRRSQKSKSRDKGKKQHRRDS